MMVNTPKRVWQHVFEDKSEFQLSDAFSSVDWVVQRLRRDYGEDLFARPFRNGNPTGQDFFIQLKGTNNVDQYRLRTIESLSYPVELSNLIQWYSYTLPVIFIVWDIVNKVGYWTHIQPFIRSKLESDPMFLENRSGARVPTRKVQVPTYQIITEDNLDYLKLVIEAEWRKIEQGKRHFEILYQARAHPTDDTLSPELPHTIRRQLKITEFQAIVTARPSEVKGWLDLAAVYYEIENMPEALKAINRAWDLDPENWNIQEVRACILAEFAIRSSSSPSMLHEAISLFESIRSGSKDPRADYNIGNCYSELGRFQEAVDHYDKAISAESESQQAAQIWTNRGNAVDKTGDDQGAVESFKHAIELNPFLWNAHASWAALEVRRGNFKVACKHFHDTFRCNPELQSSGDNIVYWFAYSLHQVSKSKKALSVINQILAVNPLHKEGLLLKAHILCKLRRNDESYTSESLAFFKNRLLDDPSDMMTRSELNLIYLDQGLADERRALLEETVTLDNVPPLALYEYAMLLENDNRIQEAIIYLEKAVEEDQSHPIVHALARLKREIGQYRDAIKYYKIALKDVSDPLPILEKMSDCYHFLNDYKSCVVVISRALLLGAMEISLWKNLDFALNKLGIEPLRFTNLLKRKIYSGDAMSDQEIKAYLATLIILVK